jgi:hypothetical protein
LNPANTATVPDKNPAEKIGPIASVCPITPKGDTDRALSPPNRPDTPPCP